MKLAHKSQNEGMIVIDSLTKYRGRAHSDKVKETILDKDAKVPPGIDMRYTCEKPNPRMPGVPPADELYISRNGTTHRLTRHEDRAPVPDSYESVSDFLDRGLQLADELKSQQPRKKQGPFTSLRAWLKNRL